MLYRNQYLTMTHRNLFLPTPAMSENRLNSAAIHNIKSIYHEHLNDRVLPSTASWLSVEKLQCQLPSQWHTQYPYKCGDLHCFGCVSPENNIRRSGFSVDRQSQGLCERGYDVYKSIYQEYCLECSRGQWIQDSSWILSSIFMTWGFLF